MRGESSSSSQLIEVRRSDVFDATLLTDVGEGVSARGPGGLDVVAHRQHGGHELIVFFVRVRAHA